MRSQQKPKAFLDQVHFVHRLAISPRHVGAFSPSGHALVTAMAAQVDPAKPGPVLELGPGSGVITKALLERGIAPERLTAIERDPEFVKIVSSRYPGVSVVEGDAFNLDSILEKRGTQKYAAIVSGLPLLNFPEDMRKKLLESIFRHLAEDAPFVQFTYGLKNPVSLPVKITGTRAAFVWNNIPPAHVWTYRRKKEA